MSLCVYACVCVCVCEYVCVCVCVCVICSKNVCGLHASLQSLVDAAALDGPWGGKLEQHAMCVGSAPNSVNVLTYRYIYIYIYIYVCVCASLFHVIPG